MHCTKASHIEIQTKKENNKITKTPVIERNDQKHSKQIQIIIIIYIITINKKTTSARKRCKMKKAKKKNAETGNFKTVYI